MSSSESKDSKSAESSYALSLFELLIGQKKVENAESSGVPSEPESATRWRVPAEEGSKAGSSASPVGSALNPSKRAAG